MTPETRADMFKRGYVFERKRQPNGQHIPVFTPYQHEDHELIFCTSAYALAKEKGFKL